MSVVHPPLTLEPPRQCLRMSSRAAPACLLSRLCDLCRGRVRRLEPLVCLDALEGPRLHSPPPTWSIYESVKKHAHTAHEHAKDMRNMLSHHNAHCAGVQDISLRSALCSPSNCTRDEYMRHDGITTGMLRRPKHTYGMGSTRAALEGWSTGPPPHTSSETEQSGLARTAAAASPAAPPSAPPPPSRTARCRQGTGRCRAAAA